MVRVGKPKLLKKNNRKAVIYHFRESDELTPAEISNTLGISKTTIMKILNFFLEINLIVSAGKGESTSEGGKRPELFRLNENFGYSIGVHIRPGSLFTLLTDLKGHVLKAHRAPLKHNQKVDSVVKKIASEIRRLLTANHIESKKLIGIGVGIPGITDGPGGIVRMSPWFSSWQLDAEFSDLLSRQMDHGTPIFIDNECRFEVFAEMKRGGTRNCNNIVTVNAGEGLAAGIIVKGELKRGIHHLAGEIGHMIINPQDTERCVCGGRGCFEAAVYVHRLIEKAYASEKEFPDSLIFKGKKQGSLAAENIFNCAARGDSLAMSLLDDIIKWFAIAFSNLIVTYDPEIIVLQGVYANAGDYFIEALRKKTDRLVLQRMEKGVDIRYSELGDEASALGAALFAISEFFKRHSS